MRQTLHARLRDDAGIGLAEILVAMLLLAVLALALLPTLIAGMKLAQNNTTIAAATQFANDRISVAQSLDDDCADILARYPETLDTTDKRGVLLRATTSASGTCPGAGSASTLNVTTTVVRVESGEELASASTLVLVMVAP